MKEAIVSGLAIIAITLLACFALTRGQDGTMLLTAIAAIAGLAGYQVGRRVPASKDTKPPAETGAGKPGA